MKKPLLTVVHLACFVLIVNTVFAQLSLGGKPYSFNKFFQPEQVLQVKMMPHVDVKALRDQDAVNDQSKGPFRFGFNHYVNYSLNNAGEWTLLEHGDRLWQLGIKSEGALSMNLAFDDFFIPEGASLFIFTEDRKHVIGAFTSKNNDASNRFATDLLPGDALVIEYYEPAEVLNQGHFNLFRVTHGYRGVEEYAAKSFGDAGSCQVNVNCPLGTNWQDQKRGVVCLVVNGDEFCTGSLVNDVPQDGKPYVLTANHCSASNDWATWVFRFNWEAPGCTSPGSSPSTAQSLNTSTLRARDSGTDFCLVEITGGLSGGTVPASYTPYFNGWSAINIPATSAMAIHHPSGDIKKISEAANATVSSTYNSADCWKTGQWTTGCTEPGSSGSPLFDQDKRIIGQLFGGPSSCGAPASSMNDYYGKFSTSWLGGGTSSTQLMVWLDPANTGATFIDGYDPNASPPAFVLDAAIQAVSSPSTGYASCDGTVIPQVVLRNYGSATLDSCTINYQMDGGSIQTYTWTGSLATNATTTITLPAISGLVVGLHNFLSFTSNPNGNLEQNASNDSSSTSFSIISPSPVVMGPQSETFENIFPSINWTIGNPNTNATWTKINSNGGFGASTSCAKMNNNTTSDITGESDYIYSPYLNLSTISAPISLTFDVAYARYSATYHDTLIVSVSNDCGATWTRLYAKGNTALATAPDNTSGFIPTSSQWRTETISLNSYAGESALKIAIENKSGWGQSIYIDNVNIFNNTSTSTIHSDFNSAFSLYPNPTKGEFNIAVNLVKTTDVTVKILNILGKVVSATTLSSVTSGTYTMDISQEAKGIYFVEISTGNEKTVRKINVL